MRRWLSTVVVCSIFGAITNLAVAWGCALWVPTGERREIWIDYEFDPIVQIMPIPQDHDYLRIQRASGIGIVETEVLAVFFGGIPVLWALPTHYAAGWPLCSLHGARLRRDQFVSAMAAPEWLHPRKSLFDARALPLRPIWPGFPINTVFYATILWLFILGRFALRRHLRRKRGLCVPCGYDLRGDFSAGCPECGWRREVTS
ncbi:MAG: hypothetical protein IH988_00925 [Planctomycetes bacterium]|nr:hypothetical protein [Planctomycetota bacterium]